MFFGINNGYGCNKGQGHKDGGCDCCTLLILILLLSNCGCGNGFANDDNGCGCVWYIILIFLLLGCVCK